MRQESVLQLWRKTSWEVLQFPVSKIDTLKSFIYRETELQLVDTLRMLSDGIDLKGDSGNNYVLLEARGSSGEPTKVVVCKGLEIDMRRITYQSWRHCGVVIKNFWLEPVGSTRTLRSKNPTLPRFPKWLNI
jgi:hypothetical protein